MFILVLVKGAKDNHIHGKIGGEPFLPRNQYKVTTRNSISFCFITCTKELVQVELVELVFPSFIIAHIVFILVWVKDTKQ